MSMGIPMPYISSTGAIPRMLERHRFTAFYHSGSRVAVYGSRTSAAGVPARSNRQPLQMKSANG